MTEDTRERILNYLHKNPTTTAEELRRRLGMTGANIRYHLGILVKEGLVDVIDARISGKGRPTRVYGLSNKLKGNGIAGLAEALLKTWQENVNDSDQEAGLRELAGYLAGIYPEKELIKTLPQRLSLTIEKLNKLHYEARWEAGSTGPRVILGNCPYAEIISRHPELCRMDAILLDGQTGLQIHQTSKLERSRSGALQCTFAGK